MKNGYGFFGSAIVHLVVLSVLQIGFAQTGSIQRQYWTGITGKTVASLTSNVNFPNTPSGTTTLTIFEGPTNWADNYGTRIRGFIHPPTTGYYQFWIASDDSSELWLSTDDKQSRKRLIASVPGTTASREWEKYTLSLQQRSDTILLVAGKRYYIEALHKEGTGNDNIAVGWKLPDGTLERPIPGNRLSSVLDNDDYSLWADSARIRLNTTPAGANITETITNFPIAINLSVANFNFARASDSGADIRFSKSDGTHLPYQIEKWDSLGKSAVIWVKVDTIFGNNNTQYITMFSNYNLAVSRSSGPAVFDTSNGYRGVWHLNQNPAGTAPQMTDASSFANNGTSNGAMTASDLVPGILGSGVDLDGTNDYFYTAKSFANPITFTYSVWFKTSTKRGGKLFGLGNLQAGSSTSYDRHLWMDTLGKVHFGIYNSGNYRVGTTGSYNDTAWHQACAQFASNTLKLYVDGTLQGTLAVTGIQNTTGYWRMGYDNMASWPYLPKSFYFTGLVDETMLSNNARSDGWIKLLYQSQKTNSTFMTIETPAAKPVVNISVVQASVNESDTAGKDAFSLVASVASAQSTARTVLIKCAISGTATNGVDYYPLLSPFAVVIPGDSLSASARIKVKPVDDALTETNETVAVKLLTDTMYTIGTPDSGQTSIIDNDAVYPPVVTTEPADMTLLQGDVGTFTIAVSGSAPLTFLWRKNGVPTGYTGQNYTVPPAILDSNPQLFDCIVSNGAGKDTTRQARLTVLSRPVAPYIVRAPASMTIAEGDSIILTVGAGGTGPFTFQWYSDTASIVGAVDSIVRLGPFALRDNGRRYYCVVSNVAGSTPSPYALITVKRPTSRTLVVTGELFDDRNSAVGYGTTVGMDFVVRIYASLTSDSVLYTESFLDSTNQAIPVRDGKFSVHLGTGATSNDLTEVVRTHSNLFIEFTVTRPGGNPETLSPRTPLTASPYALSALPEILRGAVNPQIAGIEAPIGVHFVNTVTGKTYIRTQNGWVELK